MDALTGKNSMQLHHFFEESVKNYPSNIALVCDNAFVSYQELENRSNQLAHYLHQQNITKGSIVGILLERSIECYVAILAVLKIGAAYVPIETDYPDERINYILADLAFSAVLTSSYQLKQKNLTWPTVFVLDEISETISTQSTSRVSTSQSEQDHDNLCYIIYTSGSTGKPKGVEITHRSICHYVTVASTLYEMSEQDRVYQGFSLAFDASLEELWMAFANGAALIACTAKEVRSGLGLISFLKHHQVTVYSTVPTLLSTLEGPLPDLRLLILGGETCPSSLVKRWSRSGLRIMNTYGPTEATVIATYSECEPGKEITIGKPLAGYEVFIMDEQLQEVKNGEEGELCIAGPALARGYVNRPESTSEKFVWNPANNSQRLYRTGDLALKDANGDLHFAGRVDDQIKLRGFRIELNEIEAIIMEYSGITQAVVSLQSLDQPILVAYLLLEQNDTFNLDEFRAYLRANLPDYMIPAIVEILTSFPLLSSGKVNRKELPKPTQVKPQKAYQAPVTELEQEITLVWEKVLGFGPISTDADFFYDLGGHSLLAAKVISNLRQIPKLKNISILDLYKNPAIAQIAEKFSNSNADAQQEKEDSVKEKYRAPQWKYTLCGIAQLFGVLLQYALGTWQLIAVFLLYTLNASESSFISRESQLSFLAMFLFLPIIAMFIPIGLKWILLGRVKPGQYPLWGWFYFRWWLVHQLLRGLFLNKYLAGTPLIALYYRLLGAKIGKNSHIGTMMVFTHDLLTVGDNCSVGTEAKLHGYKVEDGWLKIGSINLGDNSYIGSRTVIGLNTQIENNAILEDMSMLPDNNLIPQGSYFAGSPAVNCNLPADHVTRQKIKIEESSLLENTTFGILHYLGMVFLMVMVSLCYLPGISLINYFYDNTSYLITIFFAAPVAAILCLLLHYLGVFVCKKLIMDRVKPGQYPIRSFYYLRFWIITKMLDTEAISVMADSLYLPMFWRLLGAKFGKKVEIGETTQFIPELVTVDEGGFIASDVAIAWPAVHHNSITFAPVSIGKKAFLGNTSFLPGGKSIGDGGLLGSLSITPEGNKAADANTAWLGSPAVFLPKRELFVGYSEQETFNPSKKLYCARLAIEFVRILIPTAFSLILLFNLFYVMDFMLSKFSWLITALVLPVAELFIICGLVGVLVALKWLMLGRLKPLTKPIWDVFIWKNDIVEFSYACFMVVYLVGITAGTPFALWLHRLLGTKVGKRVFSDTSLFSEFDLISIGDDVCLNSDATLQTHLYEDRIFKVSNVTISSGCNVGVASIVLYNTLMEENATLGSLSLLMKGERLPSNTEWAGIPAQSTSVTNNLHPTQQSVTAAVGSEEVVPEFL
ncbi:Pls/PosA family non-ribosomal peptide synthetase [Legionella maioricensis]|uniref:Amino acid adenylation domain-containing protein n=1 Tax=Legionella maioricensis TaxID=2896528 RepID=A0A9X2D2F0_9GAMM|nr:Pls/PosA family non-ribosomal peptide synthetase [Legionella maioricensis]MCL9685226.1 amino acid adenylation domain-containing protein [Legionella maioricensis]MCL9688443.1 amino acid adenylation domain-containing protein [Legionella maioricensis]